jgi:hypothetical protein
MLLEEFIRVRQVTEQGFRRYFVNDYFQLWVWYENDKTTIKGFQLLWGKVDRKSAITWTTEGEFSHLRVSDEHAGGNKWTPILDDEAGRIRPATIYIFIRYAAKIDQNLVKLVVGKIMAKTGITQQMMDNVEREYLKIKAKRKQMR